MLFGAVVVVVVVVGIASRRARAESIARRIRASAAALMPQAWNAWRAVSTAARVIASLLVGPTRSHGPQPPPASCGAR